MLSALPRSRLPTVRPTSGSPIPKTTPIARRLREWIVRSRYLEEIRRNYHCPGANLKFTVGEDLDLATAPGVKRGESTHNGSTRLIGSAFGKGLDLVEVANLGSRVGWPMHATAGRARGSCDSFMTLARKQGAKIETRSKTNPSLRRSLGVHFRSRHCPSRSRTYTQRASEAIELRSGLIEPQTEADPPRRSCLKRSGRVGRSFSSVDGSNAVGYIVEGTPHRTPKSVLGSRGKSPAIDAAAKDNTPATGRMRSESYREQMALYEQSGRRIQDLALTTGDDQRRKKGEPPPEAVRDRPIMRDEVRMFGQSYRSRGYEEIICDLRHPR